MHAETDTDAVVACRIGAAIGEPARARMLYCLADGHARTSTELSVVAEVSPSTASEHLNRLKAARLVRVIVQGKHRLYSLNGPDVASALEALSVLGSGFERKAVPSPSSRLRAARTCYDHLAGILGVLLCDRLQRMGWLEPSANNAGNSYDLTPKGNKMIEALGINIEETRELRRRFAFGCLDWSERRSHLGGALGAALLKLAFKRKWLIQDLDSRALEITNSGRREIMTRFGLSV